MAANPLPKYEYHVTVAQFPSPINLQAPKVQEALGDMQRLGGEGWELVGTVPQQMGNALLFWKREVIASKDVWS